MKSFSRSKLALGSTALVLLVGAGGAVAVAASNSSESSTRKAYIDDVAKHLNVAPTALTAAMKAAAIERIEAAVASGRLSASRATELKQRVQQGDGGGAFLGRRFGAAGAGHRGFVPVAAQYLGVSAATLRGELRSGKSLAQIASATPGKSVQGLRAAILAARTARIEKAASSGSITSQEKQERLSKLAGNVERLLQRTGLGRTGRGAGLGHLGSR